MKGRKPRSLDLYGQSMLRYSDVRLGHLDEILERFIGIETEKIQEGEVVKAKPRERHERHLDLVIDICEKLGFIWMARSHIRRIESKSVSISNELWQPVKSGQVKYHFYSLIYNSKATADSCSLLFKLIFKLPYEDKQTDIIRNEAFRKDVATRSREFDAYWKKYGGWFGNLRIRRDLLIHRESMPVLVRDVKNRTTYDLQPVAVQSEGREFHFDVLVGTVGQQRITFQRKGLEVAVPARFNYAIPKDKLNLQQISIGGLRRRFKDFEGVLDYCDKAFEHLRKLSELTFKDTVSVANQEATR